MRRKLYQIVKGWVRRKRMTMALPYVEKGCVLDLGCGDAAFKEMIGGGRYTGVDINLNGKCGGDAIQKKLLYYREKLLELDIEEPSQRRDIPGQYDAIVMLAVLEHLKRPLDVVRWCEDKLKPGGLLVITTPTFWGDFIVQRVFRIKVDHRHIFNKRKLHYICEIAGMRVVRFSYFEWGANQLIVAKAAG